MGVVEVEGLKLSELLKEGQAAANLGADEVEPLKLSEVLMAGQTRKLGSVVVPKAAVWVLLLERG